MRRPIVDRRARLMVGLAAALGLVELVVFMAVASSAYVGIYNFLSSRMTTSRA